MLLANKLIRDRDGTDLQLRREAALHCFEPSVTTVKCHDTFPRPSNGRAALQGTWTGPAAAEAAASSPAVYSCLTKSPPKSCKHPALKG
jgi:hypothetical protein